MSSSNEDGSVQALAENPSSIPFGRLGMAVFVGLAIVGFSLAARQAQPAKLYAFPKALDMLILLAPSVTGFVMVCVMAKTIAEWDKNSRESHLKAIAACIMVGLAVCLISVWLGGYRGTMSHLLVVAGLYVMFSVWDARICGLTNEVKVKAAVAEGHRQINRPSIIIFGMLIAALWMMPTGFGDGPTSSVGGDTSVGQDAVGTVGGDVAGAVGGVVPATKDYFVAGTIAFHLLITALMYFTDVIPRRRPLNFVQRVLYAILRWLPNCGEEETR